MIYCYGWRGLVLFIFFKNLVRLGIILTAEWHLRKEPTQNAPLAELHNRSRLLSNFVSL